MTELFIFFMNLSFNPTKFSWFWFTWKLWMNMKAAASSGIVLANFLSVLQLALPSLVLMSPHFNDSFLLFFKGSSLCLFLFLQAFGSISSQLVLTPTQEDPALFPWALGSSISWVDKVGRVAGKHQQREERHELLTKYYSSDDCWNIAIWCRTLLSVLD